MSKASGAPSEQAIRDPEFVSQLRAGGVSPLNVPPSELFEMMKDAGRALC